MMMAVRIVRGQHFTVTMAVGVSRMIRPITRIGWRRIVGKGRVSAVKYLPLPVQCGRFRVHGIRLYGRDD